MPVLTSKLRKRGFSYLKEVRFYFRKKKKMTANTTFPYEACLIPNIPEKQQQQMRDFTNYFVRPLGMLIAVMSFISNSLVIITVLRKKSLQQPSFLMLSSLAVTDLLYSLQSLSRDIRTLGHDHMCLNLVEVPVMSLLCILATLANVALISRDRYLAIRKPWWYRHHVTKSRAMGMICVAWLISVMIALLTYLRSKFQIDFIPRGVMFYLICFFVIGLSYLGIVLKKNQPRDALQVNGALRREKRLANTVALILLVLFLTFLPGLISPLALHLVGVRYVTAFGPYYTFLLLLNGFLNPLVNFGRSKDMRRGLSELFKCSREVQLFAASNNRSQNASACGSSITLSKSRANNVIVLVEF